MKINNATYIVLLFLSIFFQGCEDKNIFTQNTLTWTSINVNAYIQQGDAHLISKNNKHILVDTGHEKYASRILVPYLKGKKIDEIDSILITHPHNDHYGGIKALIENNFKIHTIYMNMPTKKQMNKEYWGGTYDELLEIQNLAKKHNIIFSNVKIGDKLVFDSMSYMEVLYVYNGIDTPVGTTDINDMSVVSMLYHGGNKFLFTGDLNKKLGSYLAKHANNIQADILKAPHHGTEGFAPNSFFKKVSPKVLIVPSPKHLWFGKRSKRSRDLAIKNNYITYVNGFNQNITVTSDGTDYTISTERYFSNDDILGIKSSKTNKSSQEKSQ
jgi:competence protein ComEC